MLELLGNLTVHLVIPGVIAVIEREREKETENRQNKSDLQRER